MSEEIDPATVTTCEEFGRALTAVRVRAGLSVRDVAKAVDIPPSTAGGYFSGSHLPGLKPADLVPAMLRACGVTSPAAVQVWVAAWMRARRHRRAVTKGGSQRTLGGLAGGGAPPVPPHQDFPRTSTDSDGVAAGGAGQANLTLRPPVGRLDGLGVIRGRADILDRLTTALPAPAGPHQPPDTAQAIGTVRVAGDGRTRGACGVHVLYGLGGVGKSTVALTVAARALDRGLRAWWINAAGPGTVTAAMTALAVELGASQHQLAQGSLPDLLWRLLDGLDRPWLLVIDNADDPDADLGPPGGGVLDGTGLLRPVSTPFGVVIVTTRDGAAWSSAGGARPPGWLTPYRLRPLAGSDAGQALHDLAGDGPGTLAGAMSLAVRLGGLPLGLRAAGLFLVETARMPPVPGDTTIPRTYAAYEQALTTGRPESVLPDLDGQVPAGRDAERALVGPTWELSLRLLAAQGRGSARSLLTLLACLGGDPVPVGLLDPAVLASSALFPGLTTTGLWMLLRALAGHGLVDLTGVRNRPDRPGSRRDGADPGAAAAIDQVWLHPLVRDSFSRAAHASGRVEDYLETVTALLTHATRHGDPRDPATWGRWAGLRGHADAGLALLRTRRAWRLGELTEAQLPPDLLVPATLTARFLRATGHLAEAAAMYNAVLAAGRAQFGHAHADVLCAEHDLYRVRAAQGRPDEAERGLRGVLDDRARVLGPEHPDTLTTQHYLARALRESGRLREALSLLERTLRSRERVLGPRHRDTLTTRNNIADVLVEQELWADAEKTLTQVWSDRASTLGPEHPATLVTRYHLARLDHRRGAPENAAVRADELVADCRRVLGPDHPRTLQAIGLRAKIAQARGQLDASLREVADAHQRSLRVLGPRHVTTRTLQRLAELDGAA